MEYVFEDNASSMLSKLFCAGVPMSVREHIHYANGKDKLSALVNSLPVEAAILVFVDVAPGNPSYLVYTRKFVLAETPILNS